LRQTSPRRVHDLVRASIRSGELKPGDRLDEFTLIRELATSRNAVREALQMLADEGLVTRAPREGTTVVGRMIQLPLNDFVVPGSDEIAIRKLNDRIVPSTPQIRARLQTDASEVGVVEQLFTHLGEPIGVWIDYYRADVVQPDRWEKLPGISTTFELIYGVPLGHISTTVEALPCEARTMRLLGLTEPLPMLVKEHIFYDQDGTPRDLSYSHYRADRVSFTIESRPGTA